MSNEKITSDMSIMDLMMVMSEGNPGALTVLMQMIQAPRGFMDILLLDTLDIRGSKVWMLYSDSCGKNEGKFNRTLMALRCGAYSEEEIQENLGLTYALPFLDDSIQIEGVPSYDEKFGPMDAKWDEYLKANREVVVPKIHERMEAENSNRKSL